MGCSFGCNNNSITGCISEDGCIDGVCPDFVIRRHDTKPSFKLKIEDCDGPLDLTGLIVEASMWAKGKLKTSITADDTYFNFADNIGFNQIMVGDIIIMDRARLPEQMLVIAFDETNRLVQVQRAYHGTTAQNWKKGTPVRILKFVNAAAQSEMIYQDVLELDGSTTSDVLSESYFVYEWAENDTCLPGCYYFEFKLIKMLDVVSMMSISPSVIPSFTPSTLSVADFNCSLGQGVEWIRRFPVDSEGFYIKITDSPTSENITF